jgi:hypothetical protein
MERQRGRGGQRAEAGQVRMPGTSGQSAVAMKVVRVGVAAASQVMSCSRGGRSVSPIPRATLTGQKWRHRETLRHGAGRGVRGRP